MYGNSDTRKVCVTSLKVSKWVQVYCTATFSGIPSPFFIRHISTTS
jgi:hypothetical protein